MGAGFVAYCFKQLVYEDSYRLADDSSVFQAEIYAVLKAAEWLRSLTVPFVYVKICVDSRAALQALEADTITSQLVQDAVLALNMLAQSKCVRLGWVKAHVGIVGNELADERAKAGCWIPTPALLPNKLCLLYTSDAADE